MKKQGSQDRELSKHSVKQGGRGMSGSKLIHIKGRHSKTGNESMNKRLGAKGKASSHGNRSASPERKMKILTMAIVIQLSAT